MEDNLLQAAVERVKARFSAKQFQIFDFIVLKQWSAGEVAKSLAQVWRVFISQNIASQRLYGRRWRGWNSRWQPANER